MDEKFWKECWEQDEIGFHLNEVNPVLSQYWNQLPLKSGSGVFVPLCGKSLDLIWLLKQDFHVVGVELSKIAVDAFFLEQAIKPIIQKRDKFQCYQSNQLALFCGSLFDLSEPHLENIQAVYDRASLVALPLEMRQRYMDKLLKALPRSASWLLVTFEYDENIMQGPPFSVSQSEVRGYFEGYDVRLVGEDEMIGSMPKAQKMGLGSIRQCVYVMTPSE